MVPLPRSPRRSARLWELRQPISAAVYNSPLSSCLASSAGTRAAIFPPLSSTFYCHRNLAIVAAIHERRRLGFREYPPAIVERRSVRRNEKRRTDVKTRSLQMANAAKTAIVTGASRGIGAGLVEAFLKRGYSVVANSRNITKANPFAAAANVALVDGDIAHPSTAATIVDTAVSRFGRIDVLINNAGVFIPKPFTEYTIEDFNTLVSTTLAGFLYVSQFAVKQMLRQKSGSIINVSTTLVDQPISMVFTRMPSFAYSMAREGIRVNTI